MITIGSPSMVLNDLRAPAFYTMDATRGIQETTTMRQIVDMVLREFSKVGRIENLVLNAHGEPGRLHLGTGLHDVSMGPFGDVRGRVFKIWFKSCSVARIPAYPRGNGQCLLNPGTPSIGTNGHAFVSAFARLTQCYVVASTEIQVVHRALYPPGQVDSYEGLVLSYGPEGNVTWHRRYPSTYVHHFTADGRPIYHAPNNE